MSIGISALLKVIARGGLEPISRILHQIVVFTLFQVEIA